MPRPATIAARTRTAPSPIERDAREKLSEAAPTIAPVVHDPALAGDAEQIRAGGAIAALALENERLKAELRAKVEELSASRARIVESADAARRRIERDLHDGAQQRLVSVALSLRILRSRMESDRDAVRALDSARSELDQA
jgi:signal transduction histidine kinase